MTQPIQSLTLNGISYSISQFSQQVQQLTNFYNSLIADQSTESYALMKTQAAIAQVHNQITEIVKDELDNIAAANGSAPTETK